MEGGEDLNVEYRPNPNIDYREEFLNKYKNYNFEENKVDDSYVELNDKKNLIRYCKDIVSTSYNMYPEPMATILTKKLYYDTIKGMDKEAYLKEKQELKELDFVDRELKILNDNDTLNHILNDKKK